MDCGLLDLRKITPSHRLSHAFMGLENMYKYAYVRNGRLDKNERKRKEEGTRSLAGESTYSGEKGEPSWGLDGSMYIYLMPGAIRNKLLEGPGN